MGDFDTSSATETRLTKITIPDPIIPVRNTKNVVHMGKDLVVWKSDSLIEYEDNSDAEMVGSYYPTAIDVESTTTASRAVEVYLDVDNQLLGVPFFLYGGNDAAHTVVSSDNSQPLIFSTAGPHKVRVTVSPPWSSFDTPWAVVGTITWRLVLQLSGQEIDINPTRLEIYAITRNLPAFFKNVVDVRLLRRFVASLRKVDKSISWVDHCCRRTFSDFGFVYDTTWGMNQYIHNYAGGSFKLRGYLEDIGSAKVVNCFDQAAIMQICLGLGPGTTRTGWVFMAPYGFIATTSLIGKGQCNNPFVDNILFDKSLVCENNKINRSAFNSHAFISLDPDNKAKIVDTCCGYNGGKYNIQEYVSNSIQTRQQTDLYSIRLKTPGTVDDANFGLPGVTDLKGTTVTSFAIPGMMPPPAAPIPAAGPLGQIVTTLSQTIGAPPFLEGVEEMIKKATAPTFFAGTPDLRSNASLSGFFESANLSALGWTVVRSSVVASPDGTDAEWVLKPTDGDDDIVVKLFLASGGPREATIAFGTHLGTYSQVLDHIFKAPAINNHRGTLNLESVGAERESNLILLWVYSNVFVRIAHVSGGLHKNEPQVRGLADKLQQCLKDGAIPTGQGTVGVPKIHGLSGPKHPVVVGETFVVNVSIEGQPYATVDSKNGNVVLLEHDKSKGDFTFYAVAPGRDVISFCFADQSTLNSTARELEITIDNS